MTLIRYKFNLNIFNQNNSHHFSQKGNQLSQCLKFILRHRIIIELLYLIVIYGII